MPGGTKSRPLLPSAGGCFPQVRVRQRQWGPAGTFSKVSFYTSAAHGGLKQWPFQGRPCLSHLHCPPNGPLACNVLLPRQCVDCRGPASWCSVGAQTAECGVADRCWLCWDRGGFLRAGPCRASCPFSPRQPVSRGLSKDLLRAGQSIGLRGGEPTASRPPGRLHLCAPVCPAVAALRPLELLRGWALLDHSKVHPPPGLSGGEHHGQPRWAASPEDDSAACPARGGWRRSRVSPGPGDLVQRPPSGPGAEGTRGGLLAPPGLALQVCLSRISCPS